MQKFIEKISTHFLTLPHFPLAEPMWTNTRSSEGYRGFPEFLWTFKPDYQTCWIFAFRSINHDSFPYINQHRPNPEFNKKRTHMLPNPENPFPSVKPNKSWPQLLTRSDWESERIRTVLRFPKSYSEKWFFFHLRLKDNIQFSNKEILLEYENRQLTKI